LEARPEQRGEKLSAVHPTLRELHLALTPDGGMPAFRMSIENPETGGECGHRHDQLSRAMHEAACKNLGRMPMI